MFFHAGTSRRKSTFAGGGKEDHLSKAPIKDALLVGSCQLLCGWDSWVVLGDTLPLMRSDDDARIVGLIFTVALIPFPLLWGNILKAQGTTALYKFVNYVDGKVDVDMVDRQICLAQAQIASK